MGQAVMRVSGVSIAGSFKRFGSLEISSIGPEVDLVVMLGPNSSGKSSVFDAFLEWARQQGRPRNTRVPSVYFDSQTGSYCAPTVMLHDSVNSSSPHGPLLHVRTAHRNTPDVLASTVQKAARVP